jgi:hypothetical protein
MNELSVPLARALDYQNHIRQNVLRVLDGLSPEQLNQIPEGLNNNLIWNAGHLIATHELLTYGLSGERTPSGKEFINRYRKGTRPDGAIGTEQINLIREELSVGPRRARPLYVRKQGEFRVYTTSFGVKLESLEEAVAFNNLHECLHLGTMLTQRRLVAVAMAGK